MCPLPHTAPIRSNVRNDPPSPHGPKNTRIAPGALREAATIAGYEGSMSRAPCCTGERGGQEIAHPPYRPRGDRNGISVGVDL